MDKYNIENSFLGIKPKKVYIHLNKGNSILKTGWIVKFIENKINEHINIALAGVGIPIYLIEFLIFLITLYLANLIAPNTTGNELRKIKSIRFISETLTYHIKRKKDGARQKEIKSAKESISFPKSLEIDSFLAILPSKISRNADIKIK